MFSALTGPLASAAIPAAFSSAATVPPASTSVIVSDFLTFAATAAAALPLTDANDDDAEISVPSARPAKPAARPSLEITVPADTFAE